MGTRWSMAVLFAVIAGLLAAAEVVWVVGFLGASSDGPAFAMALVTLVLIPTLLAATGAALLKSVRRLTRLTLIGAVAAAGVAAAGVEAGVFVADHSADPVFIHWVADSPLFALIAGVVLSGLALWGLLRPLPLAARSTLSAVLAIVGTVGLTVLLLTAMPLVVLVGLATPVALVIVASATGRRRMRLSASRVGRS